MRQHFQSRLNYQNHQKKHNRIVLLSISMLVLLGCIGGGSIAYIHAVHHPRKVAIVKHVPKDKNYIDYHQSLLSNKNKSLKINVPHMAAKSVIALDADNGDILYQRNANQPRKVASLAKIMTIFLAEQKLHQAPQLKNQRINPSVYLRKISYDKNLGGFKFKRHHIYTVQELIQAAMIESSNNAAIALGEWVAGSNSTFVNMMNSQARAWHLHGHFVSISGLENSDLAKYHLIARGNRKSANLLTAKDMAVIAQHLIKKYPSILNISKIRSKKVDGQYLTNENELLRPGSKVDGLKTGYTDAAGMCYIGTERPSHKQHRIIVVILHDNNDFNDARALMQKLYTTGALNDRR